VIFISSNKEATPWAALDCGIAAQTIALAAHSMGLGTVILGLPAAAWDGVNDAKFNELLKFPEGYTYAISLAVGFPDGTKEAHPIGQDKVTIIG
jgi:nitroreductase